MSAVTPGRSDTASWIAPIFGGSAFRSGIISSIILRSAGMSLGTCPLAIWAMIRAISSLWVSAIAPSSLPASCHAAGVDCGSTGLGKGRS